MHLVWSPSCRTFLQTCSATFAATDTVPRSDSNHINAPASTSMLENAGTVEYGRTTGRYSACLTRDKVNPSYPHTSNPSATTDPLVNLHTDNDIEVVVTSVEADDDANAFEFTCDNVVATGHDERHTTFSADAASSGGQTAGFTTDQQLTIQLLKLLDDMHAPDYAFGEIIKWARNAHEAGYSFYPKGGLDRAANIANLYKSLNNAKQLLPAVVHVPSPDPSPVSITCDETANIIAFDFVPQLLRLLQDRSIMNDNNLAIDINNPLLKYKSPNGHLGEAMSGSVYQIAYDRYITDPSTQLFVPIIQWIDRTSVTGNDRFSLKPYMFTPAIFKETFRRRIEAWGYHGYVPKVKASSAQNQNKRQGNNIRHYHAQLHTMLDTFRSSDARLQGITLPIGPTRSMKVDIKTCILFVIQDMQEGDMLCGRYGPHTSKIYRQCRACNVNYDDLQNPLIKCRYLYAEPMGRIAKSLDDNLRQRWSQHRLENAFESVLFADPDRGIFGSTPVETMHAFRKGTVEMVTFLILDSVPVKQKAALDRLAVSFHKKHRQTYRKNYPATDFSNGVTNLTKISAGERLGLLFLFIILAQYDDGWNILNSALQMSDVNLREVLHVFEALVCFDAWLNQPEYWTLTNTELAATAAKRSIQTLMQLCRRHIPTQNPNRWKFPKFHELLHVVDDMVRFGSSINFCAQRPESLLINAAKHPGRRAQKRLANSQYELNAAQRLADTIIIGTFHDRVVELSKTAEETSDVDSITPEDHTGAATFGLLQRNDVNGVTYTTLHWSTATDVDKMQLPDDLIDYICNQFGDAVSICTEFVRGGFTFRCHPAFQSNGAINDWMKVVFEEGSFPCRLVSVIVLNDAEPKYELIVQSASQRTNRDSVLFKEWLWSPVYYTISPESIEEPCFVISIKEDHSTILETLRYESWASKFTETE